MTNKMFMMLISEDHVDTSSALYNELFARGAACVVSSSDTVERARQLASENATVVVVGKKMVSLEKIAHIPGVMSVLVDPAKNSLEESINSVVVSKVDDLKCLFEESNLNNLLGLLRLDADSVYGRLNGVKTAFHSNCATAGGVYIFGAGVVGCQVMQECKRANIAVHGFVDNIRGRRGATMFGLPVFSPGDLDTVSDVVIVSVGKHAATIAKQLRDLDFRHIFNLSEFFYAINSPEQPEQDYLADLLENRMRWVALALTLADTRSRQVLEAVISHRLTLDITPLANVYDSSAPQWFESQFLSPNRNAVFVDGGAYDGDTAEAFRQLNGPALRIHAFEPDPEIAKRATNRLGKYQEAVVHPMGLSATRAQLVFSRTGNTDGKLAKSGESVAEVASIDEVVTEAATFIKLDVEGYEQEAIAGSARHIRNTPPPLIALAVYHKASDIWKLPLQIMQLNPNYKFYLRHYTQVGYETVLYATPTVSTATENA